MEKIYFIINLQAKNGQCHKVWKKVEEGLKKENVSFQASFTEYSGHATKLVQLIVSQLGDKPGLIIAVGGDGTVHEIINGSVGKTNISIGYIPGGSGNDFARGFNIPRDTKGAVNLLLQKPFLKKIDIGKVCFSDDIKSYFVNNIGAGFDAALCKEANQSKMKAKLNRLSLGSLVYPSILIKKLFRYRCSDMVVTIDGERKEFSNVWLLSVSNQVYFGGGMKIAPTASTTDGLLNITVVHNLSKWKLLFVFITVYWGGHNRFKEVSSYLGRDIYIQSKQSVPVQADGEVIGTTPLQIQTYENAINIVAGK